MHKSADKKRSWRYHGLVLSVAFGGILGTLALAAFARRLEQDQLELEFHRLARTGLSVLEKRIERLLVLGQALIALYDSSDEVRRDEFELFARSMSFRGSGIRALGWVPKVPHAQRAQCEAAAQREGLKGFEIKEQGPEGRFMRAGTRDAYFPIRFIQPYQGNEALMGLDLGAEPAVSNALWQSCDSGSPVATGMVNLPGPVPTAVQFFVFGPVYKKQVPRDTVPQRRENLEGLVFGFLGLDDTIEDVLGSLGSQNLEIYVFDRSAPGDPKLVYLPRSRAGSPTALPSSPEQAARESRRSDTADLEVAGRIWTVVLAPGPGLLRNRTACFSTSMLLAGLLASGLLTMRVSSHLQQTRLVERLVDQRTRELAESEQRLRSIATSAQDAIIMVDDQGRITFWNDAATRIFGYTQEEAVGRNPHQFLAGPADQARHQEAWPQFQETGRGAAVGRPIELEAIRKGGQRLPVELSLSSFAIEGRWHAVAIVRDISDRKAKEKEIERHYCVLSAMNHVFEGTFRCDTPTEIARLCLAVALELTESTAGLVGEVDEPGRLRVLAKSSPGSEAWPMPRLKQGAGPEYVEVPPMWAQVLEDQTSLIVNGPALAPQDADGPEAARIESFLGVALKHSGKTTGMIALANKRSGFDTADLRAVEALAGALAEALRRRRAEMALQAAHQDLQQILDAANPLCVMDTDYNFIRANGTFCSYFQTSMAELLGKKCYELWQSPACKTAECPLNQVLSRKEGLEAVIERTLPDGNKVFCMVRAHPYRAPGAKLVGVVKSFVDITDRVRAESALRKKETELRHKRQLELIGQLTGGIAHEFNNLLQAIIGYTNYAAEGLGPDEPRHRDLQQVLKAAERAGTLTRQLLSFSRQQPLECRNLSVNQVVTELVRMVRPLIGEHIELCLDLASPLKAVFGDPGQLHQVILNLCLNARDAMPEGGQLTIGTQNAVVSEDSHVGTHRLPPGAYVVVSVSDTGCGMSAEVREHIFEPFFTTKEVGKGTGLGLATAYGIVEQHRGTILVESEPGKGTTFRVYLPAADGAPDPDTSSMAGPAPGGTETILLAEDELMVRELAARILSDAGYNVLTACDGDEAVELFDAYCDQIALVLLDAVMPKLSGHDVYRWIKIASPQTKIIFCTGYDADANQTQFIRKHELRLIPKPFDPETLLRSVREVLDEVQACQTA
ncbi:MAG: CHASE domain-containing protein [Thermoguttaceae bacterium]